MNKMDLINLRNRKFKAAILESFGILYRRVLGEEAADYSPHAVDEYIDAGKDQLREELKMDDASIREIKESMLSTGMYYSKVIVEAAEEVAEDAVQQAEINQEVPQEEGLTDTEKDTLTQVFNSEVDEDHVEQVRDAVAGAVVEEKEKAEAIKDSMEEDKETSEDGSISESTLRMIRRRPNTLLEAIYKNTMQDVVTEAVNSKSDVSKAIQENKELIKDVSVKTYTIYETIHKFGFKKYTDKMIDELITEYTK